MNGEVSHIDLAQGVYVVPIRQNDDELVGLDVSCFLLLFSKRKLKNFMKCRVKLVIHNLI